jgi:hypothetical protein
MSRQAFLGALGGAGMAVLMAGCGLRDPEPTPTPTKTPKASGPTATRTASVTPPPTATAAATWTPQPTDTPGPPTATFTPPPTPTPTASPFPAGPQTKLGVFISRNDPRVFDLLRTGNVATVKTLEYDPNFVADMKTLSPQTLIIARLDMPQIDLANLTDPKGEAAVFTQNVLSIMADPRRMSSIDGWESFNEPVAVDADQMARLAEFEAERTRLLAAQGIRSVIGNFATGHPDLALWPAFRPALEAAQEHDGYLGLHEYSAPTMQYATPQELLNWGTDPAQEGWLTLRYRKAYREYLRPNGLELPLLLTEVGIDGQVEDRPGPPGLGWRDFGDYWDELGMGKDAPGNYMEQLAWYDAELQQDAYLLGAAIYAAAASPGWESFEILGEVEPFLMQYLSVHPTS